MTRMNIKCFAFQIYIYITRIELCTKNALSWISEKKQKTKNKIHFAFELQVIIIIHIFS